MLVRKKWTVALLFGGRSSEHEVSLSSALGILKNIDQSKYYVLPVKVEKDGRWTLLPDMRALNTEDALEKAVGEPVLMGDPGSGGFIRLKRNSADEGRCVKVDVVFPVLHGTYGEDGTVQGLLSLADIPCVGAGVLASALGMDKILMKQVFFQNDLPSTDFIWFTRKAWKSNAPVIREAIENEIGFPCFVKPANTGSSVGISKIHDRTQLDPCVGVAAEYDRKLLVEKAVDARELECSVLGNDEPAASVVGEVIPCHEFYDYDAKYKKDDEKGESQIIIPADIPAELSEQARRLAVEAFKALDCAGMGRVDFLLEKKTMKLFVNEINTIPGFTPISMYPALWEASGFSYTALIDRLIELARERHADIQASKFRK